MKLNPDFIRHTSADEEIMVATGESSKKFNGLVRSNATAAEILALLENETTEQVVVDAMLSRYDAPRATVERDVAAVLAQLRSIGALEG